jgi:hypothetical protein
LLNDVEEGAPAQLVVSRVFLQTLADEGDTASSGTHEHGH